MKEFRTKENKRKEEIISVRGRGAVGAAALPQFLKNYVSRSNFQKLSANTRANMKPKQYRITRLHTKRAMSYGRDTQIRAKIGEKERKNEGELWKKTLNLT